MAEGKKIAVVGGSGRLGSQIVDVFRRRGHEVVSVSRRSGADVTTGEGLGAALEGAELIVDAATSPSPDEASATEFFTAAARNLQAAGAEQGARRAIVVSIIGIDHFPSGTEEAKNGFGGYYAAKRAQERAALDGPLPTRILRAAQFHEFVPQIVEWGTEGGTARVAEMRTQLVAVRAVAEALADLAEGSDGAPVGNPVAEVAGPRAESLVDAAKLLVAKRGEDLAVEAVTDPSDPEGIFTAGGLLAAPAATLAGPSFEQWLEAAKV